MQPGEIGAVITAAGRSSRMGRPKALLEWRGLPLLAHQVQSLAGLRDVVVVLGHEAHAIRPFVPATQNVRVLENDRYDLGRTSSLVAGFGALSPHLGAVLVVAVDQPLSVPVLERLFLLYDPAAPIAVPAFQGRRGHPVLFRADLLPELRAIDDATDGLRAVVSRYRDQRQEVEVADASILLDFNEPQDYMVALQ